MKSKNKDTLKSFTLFCEAFPELRFWQALARFAGVEKIYWEVYNEEWEDTELIDTFNKK